MEALIKLLDENLRYVRHEIDTDTIKITVKSAKEEVSCPYCKTSSSKVHSKYERKFKDLPIQGKKVVIQLKNRKMFCKNPECSHKTFAETFEFLPNSSKMTTRLEKEVLRISLNCSSVTSSKLLRYGIVDIGKSSICRLIKKQKFKFEQN